MEVIISEASSMTNTDDMEAYTPAELTQDR